MLSFKRLANDRFPPRSATSDRAPAENLTDWNCGSDAAVAYRHGRKFEDTHFNHWHCRAACGLCCTAHGVTTSAATNWLDPYLVEPCCGVNRSGARR